MFYDFRILNLLLKECDYGWVQATNERGETGLIPDNYIKVQPNEMISLFLYARLQTERIMVWWCPSVRPSGSPSARFPHCSHTCLDILSWNFAHDFVLLYYRSSSSVVTLHQFLLELCPFQNVEYWKYTVFRTFLLHTLTYWAEILHMTLFYCTTDQVWVSSISVNFCRSFGPFGT